ncbi:hypothetical protein ACOM2C_19030 [Pseudarthrobacter sp. So.54]
MRKHLSLLATAALAAVFVAAGAPAGAVPAVASTTVSTEAAGGAADDTPVVLTGRLVGPLSLSAGHHGSVTVSESFAKPSDAGGLRRKPESPLRNPGLGYFR